MHAYEYVLSCSNDVYVPFIGSALNYTFTNNKSYTQLHRHGCMHLVRDTQLSLVVGLCCLAVDNILIAKYQSHKKWYGFLLNSVTTMLVCVVHITGSYAYHI